MPDKVKPLKIENQLLGGTQDDPFPVEANPNEDYIATKGIAFENTDTKLIDVSPSGEVQFKDAIQSTYWPLWKSKHAIYNDFNNSGSGLVSSNVEDAIKEIAKMATREFTMCHFTGDAGTGKFLNFFGSMDSNTAPLYIPNQLKVVMIVSRATNAATCNIEFLNGTVSLYTLSHSSSQLEIRNGTLAAPIFTLPSSCLLKVKVTSGLIKKPHIYFVSQGL